MKLLKYKVVVAVIAAGTGACTVEDSNPPGDDPPPGPPGMVVMTRDGLRFEGPGLQLALPEGAPYGQGSIGARAEDGSEWTASFAFKPSDVRSATVRLEPRPPEAGNGFVAIMNGSNMIAGSDSGNLSYSLQGNRLVAGEATTTPDAASASFSGQFSVTCWVYPETLGQAPNGHGDGIVRVADEEFTSSFCQPFQDLR